MEILTQLWLLWICLQHCLKVIPQRMYLRSNFLGSCPWLLTPSSKFGECLRSSKYWWYISAGPFLQREFCSHSTIWCTNYFVFSASIWNLRSNFFVTAGSEIRPWQFWEVDDASISLRLLFRPPLFPPICSFLPRPPRTWDELQKYAKPSPGWSYASVYSFPSSTIHLGMCVELLLFTACNRLVVQ